MKRLALLFLTPFLVWFAQGQNCNETVDTRIKALKEAAYESENQNDRAYDSLRKEMSAIFELVENCVAKNPSYEARAKVQKIGVYFSMSELAAECGRFADMLKHIEAMERLHPSPNSISASSAAAFSVNGVNYTSAVTASHISSLYYKTVEQRVHYYYFAKADYGKVIEWYNKINNGAPADFEPASLEALLYADALYKSGKTRNEYFPGMVKAATAFGKYWAKTEDHDSAMINNRSLMLNWFYREINVYNKPLLNSADPTGKLRMTAARGLWDTDEKDLARRYALDAAQNGASDLADGLWYLDVAAGDETEHVKAALQVLERNVDNLSESDMHRLLPLAEKYYNEALADGIRRRQRKLANLRRRSTISLVPCVELVGLPFGHVPVSLNLRTGHIWQEFRFDYVWGAKTKYRFGQIFAKGSEKGERYEFTGWDAGYAFGYLFKEGFQQGNRKGGRSKFFAPMLGFDLRYANWNFSPITSNVLNDDGQVTESAVVINAKTNRYELCYRVGMVGMTRFFTFEYYMGFGIGYRTLTTAQGRNVEEETFEDPRLAAKRWNKIYMPLRLGIKIGFNVL